MDGLPAQYEGDRLLTTEQAAALLGVSSATLATWRSRRSDGPPYIVLCGRLVRYRFRDLLTWMTRQERINTHGRRRNEEARRKIRHPDDDDAGAELPRSEP